MVYNSGTGITDHIAMLDKLVEVVTSRNLTAVAVNAGGTGHAVGDVIEITATGSTSTIVAQLEVISVAAGVIDGIRIYRGGAYTVDPTTTTGNAQSGTTGVGTGATFDLTFSAASWSQNRRTQEAVSAAIGTGGTGYTVSDQITVSGGVQGFAGADAVFNVDSVSGGVITAVSLVTAGNFEEVPANDVAVTGGTGSGAELTVTWQDGTFANNEEQVCMLEGTGLAGSDAIHIIIRPYALDVAFDRCYNWALLGATGYNSALPIQTQAGVNNTGAQRQIETADGALPAGDVGAYVPLKNNDAEPDMDWWIHHTGRRITMVVHVQGASTDIYSSMYVGFGNQFATSGEYPYPLLIAGSTNDKDRLWTDSSNLTGGIVESIYFGSGDPTGPIFLRYPDGTWVVHTAETSSSGSNRSVETEFGVYPIFNNGAQGTTTAIVGSGSDVGFANGSHPIVPISGVPGTLNIQLKPTPGSGDDYYWLVAPIVMRMQIGGGASFPTSNQIACEIDGVFWFARGGAAIVSQDRFALGTKRYTIFQNGNRTQDWSYFALDED